MVDDVAAVSRTETARVFLASLEWPRPPTPPPRIWGSKRWLPPRRLEAGMFQFAAPSRAKCYTMQIFYAIPGSLLARSRRAGNVSKPFLAFLWHDLGDLVAVLLNPVGPARPDARYDGPESAPEARQTEGAFECLGVDSVSQNPLPSSQPSWPPSSQPNSPYKNSIEKCSKMSVHTGDLFKKGSRLRTRL